MNRRRENVNGNHTRLLKRVATAKEIEYGGVGCVRNGVEGIIHSRGRETAKFAAKLLLSALGQELLKLQKFTSSDTLFPLPRHHIPSTHTYKPQMDIQ